jgi:hypothetical protein
MSRTSREARDAGWRRLQGGRDGRRELSSGASRRLGGSGAAATAPPRWFAPARFGGLFPSGPALAVATFKEGAALGHGPPVPAGRRA